jgi:hypothetical protein
MTTTSNIEKIDGVAVWILYDEKYKPAYWTTVGIGVKTEAGWDWGRVTMLKAGELETIAEKIARRFVQEGREPDLVEGFLVPMSFSKRYGLKEDIRKVVTCAYFLDKETLDWAFSNKDPLAPIDVAPLGKRPAIFGLKSYIGVDWYEKKTFYQNLHEAWDAFIESQKKSLSQRPTTKRKEANR